MSVDIPVLVALETRHITVSADWSINSQKLLSYIASEALEKVIKPMFHNVTEK
jgi:hypothetical protein